MAVQEALTTKHQKPPHRRWFFLDNNMTNKQIYEAYIDSRNPALRDSYANTLNNRGKLGDKEARTYAQKTHLSNKAGKQ